MEAKCEEGEGGARIREDMDMITDFSDQPKAENDVGKTNKAEEEEQGPGGEKQRSGWEKLEENNPLMRKPSGK